MELPPKPSVLTKTSAAEAALLLPVTAFSAFPESSFMPDAPSFSLSAVFFASSSFLFTCFRSFSLFCFARSASSRVNSDGLFFSRFSSFRLSFLLVPAFLAFFAFAAFSVFKRSSAAMVPTFLALLFFSAAAPFAGFTGFSAFFALPDLSAAVLSAFEALSAFAGFPDLVS